tara:strand:+ start:139 stop:318 length:180 start_codon:yes stop_codon:yes gene_type:complete
MKIAKSQLKKIIREMLQSDQQVSHEAELDDEPVMTISGDTVDKEDAREYLNSLGREENA